MDHPLGATGSNPSSAIQCSEYQRSQSAPATSSLSRLPNLIPTNAGRTLSIPPQNNMRQPPSWSQNLLGRLASVITPTNIAQTASTTIALTNLATRLANYLSTEEGLITASTAVSALENSRGTVSALMHFHNQHISADPALKAHLDSTISKLGITAQRIFDHSSSLAPQDLDNLLTTIDRLCDGITTQTPMTATQIVEMITAHEGDIHTLFSKFAAYVINTSINHFSDAEMNSIAASILNRCHPIIAHLPNHEKLQTIHEFLEHNPLGPRLTPFMRLFILRPIAPETPINAHQTAAAHLATTDHPVTTTDHPVTTEAHSGQTIPRRRARSTQPMDL